jgi:cation diffusion facilitator CzcD-associated flavoprotein CzcO
LEIRPSADNTGVPSASSSSVAIIGAGPYGLATAAHLRHAGVDVRVHGEVMEFWHKQMPKGMMLRSRVRSSNIADPERKLTIADYGRVNGGKMSNAPLAEFLEYAHWFQRQAVPDVDSRKVSVVDRSNGSFKLELEDGDSFEAERVVVAAGLFPFPFRPAPFSPLPSSLVSHSCDHDDLGGFAGKDVAVIGGGQSALESGALLHEAGARVEIIVRAPGIIWLAADSPDSEQTLGQRLYPPTDVGGRMSGWIAAFPDFFRRLPRKWRPVISYRCIRAAGAPWLVPRLSDVTLTTGRTVTAAEPKGERLGLKLDDGSEREVDHVMLGTGYRVDITRYPFLGPGLLETLEHANGYPRLRPGLESSVPGLHFAGAPAAVSFGPIMRFVVGTWYAAPALARRIAGRRQPPLRMSY